MSSNEVKQKRLLKELNLCKKKASELISSHRLFGDENDLYIRGSVITSTSSENEFVRCEDIIKFYNNNSSCFTFKFIDDAIITLYVLTNSDGNAEKFSFSYCSCPTYQDILIEEVNDIVLDEKEFAFAQNKKDFLLTMELKAFFDKKCSGDNCLVKSLINLAKNPIYIRCDYDSTFSSEQHPEYHLTVNFIKESRFKIDGPFTFYDFVVFVLDIIYGKKEEHPRQYIRIAL